MSLTQLTTDLNIIQSLIDEPNDVGGLTAAQLKAKFDEAANAIKTYINDTHLVELASVIDGSSGADNIGVTGITDLDGATVQALIESLRNKLKSVTDGSSGADFVKATSITGLTGDTIQSLLESLKSYSDNAFETKSNITTNRKLSATGDFTGTLNGMPIVAADPGLSSTVAYHTEQLADIVLNVRNFKTSNNTWLQAIKDALAYANTNGIGNVLIPDGDYLLENYFVVEQDINLIGSYKTKLIRNFDRNVYPQAIILKGNNKIEGITYDGGNDRITLVDGDNIYYGDFHVLGANVVINSCIFDKACGTFVLGSQSVDGLQITNCSFGNYRDHAIYIPTTDATARNISIEGNTFKSTTSTRECVKFRESVDNVVVDGNTFNIPGAGAITIDASVMNNGKFTISNNNGVCYFFVGSLCSAMKVESINIVGNTITSLGYLMQFGVFAGASTQDGTSIDFLRISDNVFKSKYGMIVNGMLASGILDFIVKSNSFYLTDSNSSTLVYLIGNVKNVIFEGNNIGGVATSQTSNFCVLGVAETNANSFLYPPSVTGDMLIRDNVVNAQFISLLYEDSTGKTQSLVHWDVICCDNLSKITMIPVNVKGTYSTSLARKLVLGNNVSRTALNSPSWNFANIQYRETFETLTGTITSGSTTVNANSYIELTASITNITLLATHVAFASSFYNALANGLSYYVYVDVSNNRVAIRITNHTGSNITSSFGFKFVVMKSIV